MKYKAGGSKNKNPMARERTCPSLRRGIEAISIATEHQIAVLGFEAFDVEESGLFTVDLADSEKCGAK
jgi:hypothetical protein